MDEIISELAEPIIPEAPSFEIGDDEPVKTVHNVTVYAKKNHSTTKKKILLNDNTELNLTIRLTN